MNMSRFFIDRPIFAAVIAVFIALIGAFSLPQLALSQYPEIAPPTINIHAAYPGASAETVAETVAAPLEQEINGVEGMLYLSSSSTSDGARRVAYVVGPDGTVSMRPLQLGPISGGLRVVRAGLAPTDRVIINGVQRARPGQKVQAKPGRITRAPSAESAPVTQAPPAVASTPAR